MGNGGEMPLYNNGKKNNISSSQKQLQMQFDAWMNSLHIDKVPEIVSKEMNEKRKGKTAADFASSGKERTLIESESSIQTLQIQSSTPNNIKMDQSNTSSGKLFGVIGGTTTVPQGHVADPTKQSETSKMLPEDPNLMQNTVTFDNNNNNVDNDDDNKNNNVVDDNDDEEEEDDDDVIILSSPPPPPSQPQVRPSSSGVWSDLDDIFPSLDPLGEDVPLTQKILETPIWEWDDLYFP